MKINRFLALAAIAVLVVAAMGLVTAQSNAQNGTPPAPVTTTVTSDPAACANDQADGTEVKGAADTDTIDLQCGDQNAPDGVADVEEVAATGPDTDAVQEEVGDQNAPDSATGVEDVNTGPDTDNVQEGEGQQVEDGQPDVPSAVEAPDAASQSPAK
jgi:hypothetical protein